MSKNQEILYFFLSLLTFIGCQQGNLDLLGKKCPEGEVRKKMVSKDCDQETKGCSNCWWFNISEEGFHVRWDEKENAKKWGKDVWEAISLKGG